MQTKQVEVFLLHSVVRSVEIICDTDMSKGLFADEDTLGFWEIIRRELDKRNLAEIPKIASVH